MHDSNKWIHGSMHHIHDDSLWCVPTSLVPFSSLLGPGHHQPLAVVSQSVKSGQVRSFIHNTSCFIQLHTRHDSVPHSTRCVYRSDDIALPLTNWPNVSVVSRRHDESILSNNKSTRWDLSSKSARATEKYVREKSTRPRFLSHSHTTHGGLTA